MATISTILGSGVVATDRTAINTNFENLNTDKIETSYLDTDTTLAANSDTKIATQKAVKTYVLANVNPTGASWNEGATANSGTDSYAITVAGVTAYVTYQTFKFIADVANTGACTLNVNGLGAKTIKKDVSSDLATGDILANQIVTVIYDGTNMQLQSQESGIAKTADLPSLAKFMGVGNSSNTIYNNFQLLFGGAAAADFGWTSIGAPTYSFTHMVVGSATGVYRNMPINLATLAAYLWTNTKIKILEWDAVIVADTSTAQSAMGFTGKTDADINTANNEQNVLFHTDSSGAWYILAQKDNVNRTQTAISTPSAGRHTFRIEYNPATPTATFYIDGVSVGTISTAASFPVAASTINLLFSNYTGSTIISGLSAINISLEK